MCTKRTSFSTARVGILRFFVDYCSIAMFGNAHCPQGEGQRRSKQRRDSKDPRSADSEQEFKGDFAVDLARNGAALRCNRDSSRDRFNRPSRFASINQSGCWQTDGPRHSSRRSKQEKSPRPPPTTNQDGASQFETRMEGAQCVQSVIAPGNKK